MNDVAPTATDEREVAGPPPATRPSGWPDWAPSWWTPERSRRVALWVFVAYLVAAFAWLLVAFDDRTWFIGDDWGMLVDRSLSDPGSWFAPQNTHWSTVPTLTYQVLYKLVGLNSYLPYAALVMVAHLGLAGLLRVAMRRFGVGPWMATLVAGTYVLYGTGQQNIWFAIQISMVTSMLCGVGHLLLADHDGSFDRRDAIGLAVGFVGLTASGVAPPLVAMVGVAVLVRRGWKLALVHTVPLGAIYVLWSAWQRPGQQGADAISANVPGITRFVANAWVGVFDGLGQSTVAAVALVVLLVLGLALAWGSLRGAELRRAIAAPGAMVFGATFVLAGAGSQRYLMGDDFARSSRYVAMGTALLLPALAVAADALVRRWRLAIPVVVVVLLLGVPGNISLLATVDQEPLDRYRGEQQFLLGAAADPLAKEVSRDALPYPGEGEHQVPIGFLLAGRRAGRIPDPPPLDDRTRAKIQTRLTLSQSAFGEELVDGSCSLQNQPVVIEPEVGDRFAFDGSVVVERGIEGTDEFGGGTGYNSTWAGRVVTAQLPDQRYRIKPAAPATSFTWCTEP